MKRRISSLIKTLNKEVNAQRGGGGEWPASFDYKIEGKRIILKTNKKLSKTGFRCLDSWGMALYHYVTTVHRLKIDKIEFVTNRKEDMWMPNDKRLPNAEAFIRRVSYLGINNTAIDFRIVSGNRSIDLYSEKGLFDRPEEEVIRDCLNERRDDDKGSLLEKSFQAFLFGKGMEVKTKTNDRMAILGEDFFRLKKKQYGVLREFPTGAFHNTVALRNQLTPTDFVDLVTLNRYGNLSVIEIKLDDPKLEVMSQILDYALYFACYTDKILGVLKNVKPPLIPRPKKDTIKCYVVNNRFHKRFDDIFRYYSTKDKQYRFQIFKVVLGYTAE